MRVELSGVMKARAAGDGSFDLEVLEGNAIIRQGKNTIRRKAGETLSLSAEGAAEEVPWIVMRSPLPGQTFTCSGENLELTFSWTPVNVGGSTLTRLEIAGDRRFTRILEFRELASSEAALELPPGIYWWRAYASGAQALPDSEKAVPHKFTINRAEAPAPALLPPEAWALLAATAPLPANPVPSPVAEAPVRTAASPTAPARPAAPIVVPAGPEAPEAPLPAAEERQPENGCRIGPDQLKQSLYLSFRWKEVGGANAYILTLLDASGRELLKAGPQAESAYTLDLRSIDRGSFTWRVEALRRNGEIIERRGLPAENSFTVELPLPGNPQVHEPGIFYGLEP
jgi:hypothetical protein